MSDSLLHYGLYSPWNSPGQNSGVGSLSLLQGIFPTQGSNPGLPHCRQILYQLRHKGSSRILEWVAYSFSRGISPTQELNRGLLRCGWILYQLSYQGSPHQYLKHLHLYMPHTDTQTHTHTPYTYTHTHTFLCICSDSIQHLLSCFCSKQEFEGLSRKLFCIDTTA